MKNYRFDYGFVYEYGYNIGMFSGLTQVKKQVHLKAEQIQDISSWLNRTDQNIASLILSFCRKHSLTDETVIEQVRKNIWHIFFFAFFSGKQTIQNYIESLSKEIYSKPEVIYFQINTRDPLNQSLFQRESHEMITQEMIRAFNYNITTTEIDSYQQKGHFLKADSIVLFKSESSYFLLITDNSLDIHHLENINEPYQLLHKLLQIRSEMGAKTKFRHLSLETAGLENIQLDEVLLKYASMIREKTLLKLVQAGSYTYSFLKFITEVVPKNAKNCQVSLMAQVDYDYSLINLSFPFQNWQESEQGILLKECHNAYRLDKTKQSKSDQNDISPTIKRLIRSNILRNTQMDKEELKAFMDPVEGMHSITDHITGFQNTAAKYDTERTFRDTHEKEVKKGLENPEQKILFLTGNPGIGKTTTISKELKQQERFFFLYTSCRRAVNDDIIKKFSERDRLFAHDLVVLNTSSNDEEKINEKPVRVVNYLTNNQKLTSKKGITYLDMKRHPNYEGEKYRFYNAGDNEFRELYHTRSGVLKRLCEGVREQIDNPNIKKIIGTFSIQALKRTKGQGSTVDHIYQIFPFVRKRPETGIRVNSESFNEFVEKYPICWIMIDEITGTDEGVHLYQLLKKFLFEDIYTQLDETQKAKWNVKLIVADASITNETIIHQSLESKEEFDYPKVYITKSNKKIKPLESKEMKITVGGNTIKSWFVNANSYPASKLKLTYHIGVREIQFDSRYNHNSTKERMKQEIDIEAKQNQMIIQKILSHFEKKPNEQVIIYVQNIDRIEKLKLAFIQHYVQKNGHKPNEYEQYMTITAQLTQKEREKALRVAEQVPCVFMTSSASRGISFPKATRILAVLQTFRIERELVEQVQLYYRMRGDKNWDLEKKEIEFFIVDSYVYSNNKRKFNRDKTLIHLLSFIILVRACFVSRIFGHSEIGNHLFTLVPLGGKSISPVEQSLLQTISDVLKLLQKELARKERFQLLRELREELKRTFGNIEVQTNEEIYQSGYVVENIYERFVDCAKTNLAHLLSFQPFQPYYFMNGLVIFPIEKKFNQRVAFPVSSRQQNLQLLNKIKKAQREDLSDDLRKKLKRIYDLLSSEQKQQGQLANTFLEQLFGKQRYVAIPILAFTMVDQFKQKNIHQNIEENYLDALCGLAQSFTDVSSVTPITSEFKDIPFITFQSDALEEIFANRFRQNHLFTSTETNMLNLLLLGEM